MSLVRWTPRTELDSFWRDPFLRRFYDVFNDTDSGNVERAWYPAMDLREEKDRLLVKVEVPGIEPKDVQIDLQGDVLTVRGERQREDEKSQGKYLTREQVYGSFARTVQLPYRIQADKVSAQYKNGVLTITLPKAEEHVGRQIQIEVAK